MKNIGKIAVLGAVLAASASFAFADSLTFASYSGSAADGLTVSTPTVSNTAVVYDGYTTGGGAPYNASNPYSYISHTAGTAYEISPNSQWHSAISGSSWVGLKSASSNAGSGSGGYVVPNGYYTFTTTFDVTSGGLYNFSLNLLADDTVAVFLNGANTPEVSAGSIGGDGSCSDNDPTCKSIDPATFSAVLGANSVDTLTFVVEQTGLSSMGLDFTGTASNATPEPSSLMLLGTGLVGAAGMFFRKRATA